MLTSQCCVFKSSLHTNQIVKMSGFWKTEKADDTPRRAILEFLNKATPKESPATEDIQTNKVPEPLSQDMTPATETRNVRGYMKRKLLDEDKAKDDALAKKVALGTDSIEMDSVLGISDIPSQLDSPVINLPKRPNLENRRRVSMAAFKNAIEKNRAHQNIPITDHDASEISGLSDASIPLKLNSPDVNLPRRQEMNSKKRVSTAAFKHAIEKSKTLNTESAGKDGSTKKPDDFSAESSGLMDSSIPSLLNTPELNLPQRSDLLSKKRVSTASFKDAITKSKNLSSKTITDAPALNAAHSAVELSKLESETSASLKSTDEKSRILETQPEKSDSDIPPLTDTVDSTLLKISQISAVQLSGTLSKSRASSAPSSQGDEKSRILETQPEKVDSRIPTLTDSVDSIPLDISNTDTDKPTAALPKSRGSSVSIKHAVERSEVLETQSEKKEDSTWITKEPNEKSEVVKRLSIKDAIPGLELSSSIDSSIPSTLDSPNVNILQRPGAKSKKRVSTTAFKEALQRRKQLEAPAPKKEVNASTVLYTSSINAAIDEFRTTKKSELTEPVSLSELVTYKDVSTSHQNKTEISGKLSELITEKPESMNILQYSENSERNLISIRNISDIEPTESTPNRLSSLQNQSSPMLSGSLIMDSKYADHELPESENAPEVALPEDFYPVASSTQMADKMLSEEVIEVNQSVNLSVSDIPSDMDSTEKGPALRLPSQGSKKRVSMTEFLTALSKRKVPTNPSSDSPEKESNVDGTYTLASQKSSSSQSTSPLSTNKTAPVSSNPSGIENVTVPGVKDSNSQSDEIIRRNPASITESKSRLASISTVAPPEFLDAGSSADAEKTAEVSTSKNRSRKSLKFDSPTPKEVSAKLNRSNAERSSSDEEDSLEPDGEESSPQMTSEKDLESPVLGLSPTMKNSTVIAGGMSFYEPPLPISPIGIDAKDVPSTVQATPNQSTKKRPVPQSPMYMSVMQKVLAQKTKEDKLEEPVPKLIKTAEILSEQPISKSSEDRPDRPESQLLETSDDKKDMTKEPVLMSKLEMEPVSKSESNSRTLRDKHSSPIKTASSSTLVGNRSSPIRLPQLSDDEWEDDEVSNANSSRSSIPSKKKSGGMKSFVFKGSSSSNRTKGKSLASATEDEIPLAIRIAQETIVDRSRNFVPLEQRLKADPVFQEKVRCQREKIAAEKAARAAVEVSKKRPPVFRKTAPEDNVASASINKANLRFYSQPMKVTKDALDSVHSVVGQWLEFTLDQMGIFCANRGIQSLETWEDCYKMLKNQGIVDNYWEYSGLCHELLTQEECSQLLPSGFPSEHYLSKRATKRK